jgi:hypothetical protein
MFKYILLNFLNSRLDKSKSDIYSEPKFLVFYSMFGKPFFYVLLQMQELQTNC